MHPVSQRLTFHAALTRGIASGTAFQNQGESQHSPCRRRVLRPARLAAQRESRYVSPCDPYRHRLLSSLAMTNHARSSRGKKSFESAQRAAGISCSMAWFPHRFPRIVAHTGRGLSVGDAAYVKVATSEGAFDSYFSGAMFWFMRKKF